MFYDPISDQETCPLSLIGTDVLKMEMKTIYLILPRSKCCWNDRL